MAGDADLQTSNTLLGRLQDPTDAVAWGEFVGRYGPRIYSWCQRWRLQEADAQDVTQTVLTKLVLAMRKYRYNPDGSFRGWLYKVTHHVLCDMMKDRNPAGQAIGGGSAEATLANLEAREDLKRHLAEEFDVELLQLAMERVRLRVEPNTWQSFYLVAFERLSLKEVADRLAMNVGTVCVYHGRVTKRLQEEIARLKGPDST